MFNHHGCKYHTSNNSCTDNTDLVGNSALGYFGIELVDLCMAHQRGYCSPLETGHYEDFGSGQSFEFVKKACEDGDCIEKDSFCAWGINIQDHLEYNIVVE